MFPLSLISTASSNSSAKPYYGPDEDATTIFIERTFIAGDLLCGLGYGIQLVMYAYCAHYLWTQRRARAYSIFILAFMTALLATSTVFVGVQAYTVQLAYVDNRNYPGGPWTFFLESQSLPVNVAFEATLVVLNVLCDSLVLWRCWTIWRAAARGGAWTAWAASAFPALMLLASLIMGTLWTLQSSQPGLSFYSALPLSYGISYYTISLSLNVVLTILIVARLLWYRRALLAAMPAAHARHYLSLAAVLVESAALYSFFALGFLISYGINNPINQIFLSLAQSAQQISAYLIIYRLADGRAWKSSTLARETLPPMQFGARPAARTTTTTGGVTSEYTGTDTVGGVVTPSTPADKEKAGRGWSGDEGGVQFVVV